MTIRLKILLTCFLFALVVIGFGLFSRQQVTKMGDLGISIYDRVVMSIDYARKSQVDWVRFTASHPAGTAAKMTGDDRANLDALLTDLDVTIDRGITEKSKAIGTSLRGQVKELHDLADGAPLPDNFSEIDKNFQKLVLHYAND